MLKQNNFYVSLKLLHFLLLLPVAFISNYSWLINNINNSTITNTIEVKTDNFESYKILSQISYAIVTNPKRQEKYFAAAENTWAKSFPHRFWFTFHAPPNDQRFIRVPTYSKYARSSWEEMNALRYLAMKYPESPWYMKSDDDVWISGDNLAKTLATYDPHQDWYLGSPLIYSKGKYAAKPLRYCAGGVGYLISNSVMKKINSTLLSRFDSCCSDVQIGRLIAIKANITCTKLQGMMPVSINDYLPLTEDSPYLQEFEKPIGFHYVDPKMMAVFDLLLSKKVQKP